MNLVNPASDNNRLAGDRPPHYGKKDDFPRQEVPNLGNLGNEALARLCSWRSPDRQRDKIRRSCSTGRGVTRSGDLVLQGAVVNSCVLASFRVCAVVNRAYEYPCVFLRVRGFKTAPTGEARGHLPPSCEFDTVRKIVYHATS